MPIAGPDISVVIIPADSGPAADFEPQCLLGDLDPSRVEWLIASGPGDGPAVGERGWLNLGRFDSLAQALNAALGQSQGRWLAVVDPAASYPDGWLGRLADLTLGRPTRAVVCPVDLIGRTDLGRAGAAILGPDRSWVGRLDRVGLIDRRTIDLIGPFDPSADELAVAELVLRIRRTGGRINRPDGPRPNRDWSPDMSQLAARSQSLGRGLAQLVFRHGRREIDGRLGLGWLAAALVGLILTGLSSWFLLTWAAVAGWWLAKARRTAQTTQVGLGRAWLAEAIIDISLAQGYLAALFGRRPELFVAPPGHPLA